MCGAVGLTCRRLCPIRAQPGRNASAAEPRSQLVKKGFLTSWWTGEYLPRHCHPLQSPLKSLRISGRGDCREPIFPLENEIFRRKNRPPPAYTPPGTIDMREGCGPLALSLGFFDSLSARRSPALRVRARKFLTGAPGNCPGMERKRRSSAQGCPAKRWMKKLLDLSIKFDSTY